MPNILKNKPPVQVILDGDKNDDKPAAFLVKRLTFGESHNLSVLMDGLGESKDADDLFGKVKDVLGEVIVGWKNMGDYKFGEHDICDILQFGEAIELVNKVLSAGQLTGEEKN